MPSYGQTVVPRECNQVAERVEDSELDHVSLSENERKRRQDAKGVAWVKPTIPMMQQMTKPYSRSRNDRFGQIFESFLFYLPVRGFFSMIRLLKYLG